jgi:hypothetical protein
MGGGAWPFLVGGVICLKQLIRQRVEILFQLVKAFRMFLQN